LGRGPKRRAAERAAERARRTGRYAHWLAVGHQMQQEQFFLRNLHNKVLIDFCSVFGQISLSFFYLNYSNENLFREFKSDRSISAKFKVYEFYLFFPLQIVKSNCLNAIK
jgi:hypothetical protein